MDKSYLRMPVWDDLHLGSQAVHVWTVNPDELRDPDLLAAYERLLTPDEAHKWDRLLFPRGRHESLVTRALVRTTLSRYAAVPPAAWRFLPGEQGRPELEPGQCQQDLHFSLSHTTGLVACAVAEGREVGVDVECIDCVEDPLAITERFFAPFEVRTLYSQPPALQRERFGLYWTLKESYMKARGMGLTLPLHKFSFHVDEEGPIHISLDEELDDDARRWQFATFRATDRHRLAIAVDRHDAGDLHISLRRTTPLGNA